MFCFCVWSNFSRASTLWLRTIAIKIDVKENTLQLWKKINTSVIVQEHGLLLTTRSIQYNDIDTILRQPYWWDLVWQCIVVQHKSCTLHLSTRSLSATMSTERGSWPAGAFSGISCRVSKEKGLSSGEIVASKIWIWIFPLHPSPVHRSLHWKKLQQVLIKNSQKRWGHKISFFDPMNSARPKDLYLNSPKKKNRWLMLRKFLA